MSGVPTRGYLLDMSRAFLAHIRRARLDELQQNMAEVIGMLLEDGEPRLESEFIGTQKVQVA